MTNDSTKTKDDAVPAVRTHYELSVSSYDQVTSMIIALIVLIGVAVIGLLVILYTSRVFARQESLPVTMENLAGRGDNALGLERDVEPLGVEDAPDLAEPQLQESLAAVSDAISDSQALLENAAFDGGPQASRGSGKGDSRKAGKSGEGIEEKVPRAQRWEIRFAGGNIKEYAKQLDYFGIELAVLEKDGGVRYAYNLAQAKPDTKTKSPDLEERLYMTWRSGPLAAADRELLGNAGIETQGRITLQFYSPQAESSLALKEKEHAGTRKVNDIRKTIYGVRAVGDGYEFYVIDQRYF